MDVFGWFFSSLTSPPEPAAPHNRTKYQQPTCAMQFSPCLFLHGFCPVFQHAERDTCSRLCWPKFSIRSVGTVKFVCFLCEYVHILSVVFFFREILTVVKKNNPGFFRLKGNPLIPNSNCWSPTVILIWIILRMVTAELLNDI